MERVAMDEETGVVRMTFCRMCGKLLQNVQFNPSEIVLCQKCADTMKGELVRVVRCKDCKQCYFASNRVPDERSYACGKHGIDIVPDWFCADGEKAQE